MRIAITGAAGLLGFHLRCKFQTVPGLDVRPVYREDFSTLENLQQKISDVDCVIHLAGMNRGPDEEVYRENVRLAKAVAEALERSTRRPTLIFASSTHIFRDSPYGKSKRDAATILKNWADGKRANFIEAVLPHVFGEFGKPFYNSAISTFCHQLSEAIEPAIVNDSELELVHALQVADFFLDHLRKGTNSQVEMKGQRIKVSAVLDKLKYYDQLYRQLIIPQFQNLFELYLFNTYRSYLYKHFYPVKLELRTDPRGSLFEVVKTHQGGQGFLSSTKPGVTRGNHYHFQKVERFCVVSGEAVIRIRKLLSNDVREFVVSGLNPSFIDIPTMHTHNITNTGTGDLMTFFWSHEIFDPMNPDTYAETV